MQLDQSLRRNHIDPQTPWYAQRWPWLLMAGPVAVIVAGSFTTWLAFSRPDALVVDDYYTQGKTINQDLRRDKAANTLNLASTLRYDPASAILSGTLRSFDAPLPGKIRLHLVHSTQPAKDIVAPVEVDAEGKFALALPMLEKARWQVLIENEQRQWRLNGAWAWPQQLQIELKTNLIARS
ncbi:MAG: FixH family protein [Pseudomonadota bacterium]